MNDQWIKDDCIFVCDNLKFVIAENGSTICPGSVVGKVPDGAEAVQTIKEVVLQQPVNGNVPTATVMQQKHAGGRPVKKGEVHRATSWRREKAEQGVLPL